MPKCQECENGVVECGNEPDLCRLDNDGDLLPFAPDEWIEIGVARTENLAPEFTVYVRKNTPTNRPVVHLRKVGKGPPKATSRTPAGKRISSESGVVKRAVSRTKADPSRPRRRASKDGDKRRGR